MSAVIKTWARRFGISVAVLLALLVLAVGLLAWLAGSERGLSLLVSQANERVPGLALSAVSGDIASGPDARSIVYDSAAMRIEARGLESQWRGGCLLQRQFCVDSLNLDELLITLRPGNEDAVTPTPAGPIELPDIALPIDVQVQNLRIGRLVIESAGEAVQQGDPPAQPQVIENIHLSARTEDSILYLETLSLQRQNLSASVEGEITLTNDYPLDLQLSLNVAELYESLDQNLNAQLSGSVADLSVQWQGSGLLSADGQVSVEPLDPTLPLQATLTIAEFQWPPDSTEPASLISATETSLSLAGNLTDYALQLDTRLGGAQVPRSRVQLDGQVNAERLTLPEVRIETLDGTIRGDASVLYANGLSWRSSLSLDALNPGAKFAGLDGQLGGQLRASGDVVDGQWSLRLDQSRVQGTLRGFPLALNTTLSKQGDNRWTIDELQLNNERNRLDIKGSITDRWALQVDADLPQLQNVMPGLAGGFDVALALTGPLQEPNATLTASSQVLKWNDFLIQNLDLNASIERAGLEPSELGLSIGTVQASTQRLLNTRLALTGTRDEHTLDFFVDGPQATSVDLQAAGSLSQALDWAGQLRQVELELPAHTIELEAPVALAWNQNDQRLQLDAHCWVSQEARLCLDEPISAASSGQAPLRLENYALDRLRPFLPAESNIAGSLGAEALLEWGPTLPGGYRAGVQAAIGEGQVSVLDELSGETIAFPYDQISLDASADAENIDGTLAIRSERLGDADIEVGLAPGAEESSLSGQLDLRAFKLDFLSAFISQLDTVGGSIDANGALSGTLTAPRFDGTVVLSDPELQGETLPLSVDGGQLTATIRGRRAFLSGELRSGDSGVLSLDGSANWQQSDWQAQLELAGEQLVIVQNPVQRAVLNPDITIRATPARVDVGGSIDIPEAQIVVDDLPQGASTLSEDIVIVEDENAEQQREQQRAEPPFDLRVNLEVMLGDKVTVAAYGLDASLTGDIAVRLRGANPVQLGGEISVDGQYKQYGQNLQVSDGQILFVGPIDQTRLDLDAIRDIEGEERIAGLRITGRVQEPEIELFTDPADKGEEAILSYIVLGRDIGEQSDAEANLLASAALALTLRGGRDVGTRIADTLGIEEFALESRGRGDDTEVVVSGRLNDRLLLSYGQSVFEPAQTLYLRYDLSRRLYLEAANGAQSALDIFYNFSF